MSKDETVQKKLNLREPYAEALEQAAEEVYGSRYKQARVVENLLDQTRYQPDSGRIADDLKRNVFANGPSVQMPEDDDEEDEQAAVEELSADEKLSQLKELDIDRGEVVAEWLRQNGPDRIERSFVVDVIQEKAGYSQSMAYNIARDVLARLVPSPFNDANLDDWAREQSDKSKKNFDSFAAFAGVDESDVPDDVWFPSEKLAREAYQQAIVKVRVSDAPTARKEAAFEKLANERPSYVKAEWVEGEYEYL